MNKIIIKKKFQTIDLKASIKLGKIDSKKFLEQSIFFSSSGKHFARYQLHFFILWLMSVRCKWKVTKRLPL